MTSSPDSLSVTVIQRFGGALNLNPHFHTLVPDGVFLEAPDGSVRFHRLPPPTDQEVAALLTTLVARLRRLLIRRRARQDGFDLHANTAVRGKNRPLSCSTTASSRPTRSCASGSLRTGVLPSRARARSTARPNASVTTRAGPSSCDGPRHRRARMPEVPRPHALRRLDPETGHHPSHPRQPRPAGRSSRPRPGARATRRRRPLLRRRLRRVPPSLSTSHSVRRSQLTRRSSLHAFHAPSGFQPPRKPTASPDARVSQYV